MSEPDDFAKQIGMRWATAIREQLEQLIGAEGVLAMRVYFLHQVPNGLRTGAVTLKVSEGAAQLLHTAITEQLAGRLATSHRASGEFTVRKKS